MPVNFFDAHKTESSEQMFGLCDDRDPAKNPAYIDEKNQDKWIGKVENANKIPITFYGLDNSIEIFKAAPKGAEKESMCDGLLVYDNNLAFVELKERGYSGWLAKATDQLINSVTLFSGQYTLNDFNKVEAYICNTLSPKASSNHNNEKQRFRDETAILKFKGQIKGLEMDVKRVLTI